MASDIAKRYTAKYLDPDTDGGLTRVIDAALRASHAQRTRRENAALDEYLTEVAARPGSVYEIKTALKRARRGIK